MRIGKSELLVAAATVGAGAAVGVAIVPADQAPARDESGNATVVQSRTPPSSAAGSFQLGEQRVKVSVPEHRLQPNTTENERRGMWYYRLRLDSGRVSHVYPAPGEDLKVVVRGARKAKRAEHPAKPSRPRPAQTSKPEVTPDPAPPAQAIATPVAVSTVQVRIANPAVRKTQKTQKTQKAKRRPARERTGRIEKERTPKVPAPVVQAPAAPAAPAAPPPEEPGRQGNGSAPGLGKAPG